MSRAADAPDVADAPRSHPGALARSIAGVVAAGLALATTEIAGTVLNRTRPSVIGAIANRLIVMWAGSLKNVAVDLFGTNDKAALLTGIVVVSLAVGAILGLVGRRLQWVPPLGFLVFAIVGMAAADADPLASTRDAIISSLLGALLGSIAVALLLRNRAANVSLSNERRDFVVGASAVAAVAIGATLLSRSLRTVGRVVTNLAGLPSPKKATPVPDAQPFTVPGLTPYLTPSSGLYRIDTATFVPQVEAASWRLKIDGLVDKPKTFTYADLLSMDLIEEPITIACVSNDVGGHLVGNALWRGVPLAHLLDAVGVHPDATQIVGRAVDDFTVGFPTATALDGRVAMVALGMNGEPLPAVHGYPARLIIAGLYGYVSATKWLAEINLTRRDDFNAFWIDRGWSKDGPIKTETRIDVPASGTAVPAGAVEIAGVSWEPSVGVSKVEVQIDRGPWRQARLGAVGSRNTWVQWLYTWDGATAGDHIVAARATDRNGVTQTDQTAPPEPSGATGYPYRGFQVR